MGIYLSVTAVLKTNKQKKKSKKLKTASIFHSSVYFRSHDWVTEQG